MISIALWTSNHKISHFESRPTIQKAIDSWVEPYVWFSRFWYHFFGFLEVDNEINFSLLFQTMNISTISEIDDIITNDTSIQKMTKSSSNIFDLYMQNRSIGEPYYSGLDHVFQDLFYFSFTTIGPWMAYIFVQKIHSAILNCIYLRYDVNQNSCYI